MCVIRPADSCGVLGVTHYLQREMKNGPGLIKGEGGGGGAAQMRFDTIRSCTPILTTSGLTQGPLVALDRWGARAQRAGHGREDVCRD
jgi:hypothetical protein